MDISIKVKNTKYNRKVTEIIIPDLSEAEKKQLLRTLKKKLGTGGYIEDGKIILRGDLARRVVRVLRELGETL